MDESPITEAAIRASLARTLGPQIAALLWRTVAAAPAPAAFVGGWLRDLFLDRRSDDVDLLSGEPRATAEALLRGGARRSVCLDARRGTWRLIFGGGRTVDVCAPKGEGLYADLAARDFTVNAMAWIPGQGLVDPHGGRADLAARRLRWVQPDALRADPLRALRAWRQHTELGLELDDPLREAAAEVPLDGVSAERIRGELRRILLHPGAAPTLRAMEQDGLLGRCLPLPLDLARWRRFDTLDPTEHPAICRCLRAASCGDGDRVALALGLLLEAAPERLLRALQRSRWSAREAQLAAAVAEGRRLAAAALLRPDASRLERAQQIVSWRWQSPWLLLGIASARPNLAAAEVEIAAFLDVLDPSWERDSATELPAVPDPLVGGRQAARALQIKQGPELGRRLAELQAAQLLGEVVDEDSALAWLRSQSRGA